jgi:hypothetical protein
MIKENHHISQQAIANKISISLEEVQVIIADLIYQKLCARWVAQMFTEEMKQANEHMPTIVTI